MDSRTMQSGPPAQVKMTPIWEATMQMRWLVVGRKKTLQQLFIAKNTGDAEWKEIPEVREQASETPPANKKK